MSDRTTITMADRFLGGALRPVLIERRRSGESYGRIATWLLVEHGIDVTGETVRNWFSKLDHDAEASAS